MDESRIREIVKEELSNAIRELNASRPSCKISRTTAGKPSFETKVYGPDIVLCVNQARAADRFLFAKFFNEVIDDEQMPPIDAYEAEYEDVPTHPMKPAPAFDESDDDSAFE